MTKQELRKIYLEKRLKLSDIEYDELSQQICDQFFRSVDLSQLKVVHLFLPIKKNKEPNTWFIIDRLKNEFPFIKIAIPKVEGDILINYYLDSDCRLQENKWGIFEPIHGNLVNIKEIDLVLVPLLAFDLDGHRVGYGKGYYDRFLHDCKDSCFKIGISFFNAIEKITDANDFDIKLDGFIVQ
jgi:5-formyltetrahydrofolate cyclo-ligase